MGRFAQEKLSEEYLDGKTELMNYSYLLLAVACITVQFSLTKTYQIHYVRSLGSLLFFPLSQACLSVVFFLCLAGFQIKFGVFSFVMAFLCSLINVTIMLLSILIVRLGKLSIYTLFLMLGGMLIPFLYGIVALGETVTTGRITGMIILSISLVIPFLKRSDGLFDVKRNGKECKTGFLYIFLCLCVFILNGCNGIVAKTHQINKAALNTDVFLVWQFL